MPKDITITLFLVTTLLLCTPTVARIKPLVLPTAMFDCIDSAYKSPDFKEEASESICVSCISKYIWRDVHVECGRTSNETLQYLGGLLKPLAQLQSKRAKRQSFGFRQRKEVRSLTPWELQGFIRACNMLKADTSFSPNLYDLLAQFHDSTVRNTAHFGPAFLPWHRVFLFMFEEALQSKVPGVTIPYWDSTLDNNMLSMGGNPVRSVLWSDTFFGNGNGFVRDGPFRWQTPYGPLTRNHGMSGRLFTNQDVNIILNMRSGGQVASYLEEIHNSVHNWVGGHMSSIRISPTDPIFFMHHAYVDYLWWQWQRRVGGTAAFTYPANGFGSHAPNAPILNIPLGERYTNADGYSAAWANMVSYQSSPSCFGGGSCGSPYLICSPSGCASREMVLQRFQPQQNQFSNWRKKRAVDSVMSPPKRLFQNQENTESHDSETQRIAQTDLLSPSEPNTDSTCFGYSVQNDYRINCKNDDTLWAYLPVKIIHLRPNGKVYNSHPIKNGVPDMTCDMYSALNNTDNKKLSSYVQTESPSSYRQCKEDESGMFRATLKSFGMNYVGYYTEYAILDNRQPIDAKVAYIGFKKPDNQASKVLMSVFDHCGRICRPKCLVPGSNPPQYKSCSGLLNINAYAPKFYGDSYGDAVLSYWNFNAPASLPSERENKVFVVFYCDYKADWWPWRGCKVRTGTWSYS